MARTLAGFCAVMQVTAVVPMHAERRRTGFQVRLAGIRAAAAVRIRRSSGSATGIVRCLLDILQAYGAFSRPLSGSVKRATPVAVFLRTWLTVQSLNFELSICVTPYCDSWTKTKSHEVLTEIGVLLELKGENPFKTRAYGNGARALEAPQ